MRDGIHKTLSQPRPWRGLLRSCAREAERGETAYRRAKKAIESDLATELTPGFIRRLVLRAAESETLLPSFKVFDDNSSSRDLAGENAPLENLVLDHARRLERDGIHGARLANDAVEGALVEWMHRRMRHMTQHCLGEAGEAARPMLDAVRAAIAAQDFKAIVAARLAGDQPAAAAEKRPINLDEDLAKPR